MKGALALSLDGTKAPFMTIADNVLAAEPRLGNVRVLAIDGPSGIGKTTFAETTVAEFRRRGVDVLGISTDEFASWDHPVSWWPRLRDGVLEPFSRGATGSYRRVDWTGGVPRPSELITVCVPEVLVLEGVSAGRASIRDHLACLCWLTGPDRAGRLERAVARDGENERNHLSAWQEFELGWFAVDRAEQAATVRVRTSAIRPHRPVDLDFATISDDS